MDDNTKPNTDRIESIAKSFAIAMTPIAVAAVGPLFAWQTGQAEGELERKKAEIQATRLAEEQSAARDERKLNLAVDILRTVPSQNADNMALRRWAASQLGFDESVSRALETQVLPDRRRPEFEYTVTIGEEVLTNWGRVKLNSVDRNNHSANLTIDGVDYSITWSAPKEFVSDPVLPQGKCQVGVWVFRDFGITFVCNQDV